MTDTLMFVDCKPTSLNLSSTISGSACSGPAYRVRQIAMQAEAILRDRTVYGAALNERVDITVLPGRIASQDAVQAVKDRRHLLDLVRRFLVHGFSQRAGIQNRISSQVAATAFLFILLLPNDARMPRIAPDGEGAVVAIWGTTNGPLIVNIDERQLHFVVHATTKFAEYYDNVPFSYPGLTLPDELRKNLPKI